MKTKRYEVMHRRGAVNSAWITLCLDVYHVEAQAFRPPSQYGIGARDNDGNWLPGVDPDNLPQSARISRLTITTSPTDWGKPSAIYNYDRGLDYDDTPPGLLNAVIAAVLDATK